MSFYCIRCMISGSLDIPTQANCNPATRGHHFVENGSIEKLNFYCSRCMITSAGDKQVTQYCKPSDLGHNFIKKAPPPPKSGVVNVWVSILLKNWLNESTVASTILLGVSDKPFGDIQNENKYDTTSVFRMNKTDMRGNSFILRNPGKGRKTFNAILEFKKYKVFDVFPFQVFSFVCELELQGTNGFEKYNIAIPSIESFKNILDQSKDFDRNLKKRILDDHEFMKRIYMTNLLSIKGPILDDFIKGSQSIFVDKELDSDSNEYFPRIFIRFLKTGNWISKCFIFYAPFTILWGFAILSYQSINDTTNDPTAVNSQFLSTVLTLVLTIVVAGSGGQIIDNQNWREIILFNAAVLSYVAMLLPYQSALYIPGLLLLWPFGAAICYLFWTYHHLDFHSRFRTVEKGDPDFNSDDFKATVKTMSKSAKYNDLISFATPANRQNPSLPSINSKTLEYALAIESFISILKRYEHKFEKYPKTKKSTSLAAPKETRKEMPKETTQEVLRETISDISTDTPRHIGIPRSKQTPVYEPLRDVEMDNSDELMGNRAENESRVPALYAPPPQQDNDDFVDDSKVYRIFDESRPQPEIRPSSTASGKFDKSDDVAVTASSNDRQPEILVAHSDEIFVDHESEFGMATISD